MKPRPHHLILQFVTVASLLAGVVAQEPAKKLIELGYDMPSNLDIRDHCEGIDNASPFDGVVFDIKGPLEESSGRPRDLANAMNRERWEAAWFEAAANDIRSCDFKHLKYNFVRVFTSPGDLDWFNDEDWSAASHNFALHAKLAKDVGAEGIFFDPETYVSPQYSYQDTSHSFEETEAKARQRGAELMKAMTDEYPEMTFVGLWLFSRLLPEIVGREASTVLPSNGYGLYPAFINGMLDALPATATLVDATEHGYFADSPEKFQQLQTYIKQVTSPLVSGLLEPENINKYKAQVQVGFGLYLDAYVFEKDGPGASYYIGESATRSRSQVLRDSVQTAVALADEYVWIYGEQGGWWPTAWAEGNEEVQTSFGAGRPWDEIIPGLSDALRWAKHPDKAAPALVQQAEDESTAANLLDNPSFASSETVTESNLASDWSTEGAPPGWAFYVGEGLPGTLTWDKTVGADDENSLQMKGLADGAVIQNLVVKPGEQYVISADARSEGASVPVLQASWGTEDIPLLPGGNPFNVRYIDFVDVDGSTWQRALTTVTVPSHVTRLVIVLYAAGQATDADITWFDNIKVYNADDLFR